MHHAKDGWYFKRHEDGSVEITAKRGQKNKPRAQVVLTAAEWASAITSVSAKGETAETFAKALALHEGT